MPRIRSHAPAVELYNLAEDPGETRNLAAEQPERVARLLTLMHRSHIPNPDFPLLPEELPQ